MSQERKRKERKEEGKREKRTRSGKLGTQPGEEAWATGVPGPSLAGVGVNCIMGKIGRLIGKQLMLKKNNEEA